MMNIGDVNMPSRKMSGRKLGVSLIREYKPMLLDQLRENLRARHYSRRTEQAYCNWVERFIHFHNVRHPVEMAETEINDFLTTSGRLSAQWSGPFIDEVSQCL